MVAPRYIYIYNKNIIPDFEHMPDINQMLNSDQDRPEQYTYETEEDFILQDQKMPGPTIESLLLSHKYTIQACPGHC